MIMDDVIKRPPHYMLDGLNVETIDVLHAVVGDEGFRSFCHGNVIKYIIRANKKNGLEDLKICEVKINDGKAKR